MNNDNVRSKVKNSTSGVVFIAIYLIGKKNKNEKNLYIIPESQKQEPLEPKLAIK